MPETAAALAAWVRAYVAESSREENVEEFVAQIDAAILADTPELADDPVLVAELHASTRAQFRAFMSLLEREKQELLLPPQAADLALAIARRNLDLGVLLKVYRVAAAAVWTYFTRVVDDVPEGGPDRSDVLVYLWDHAGTWINEATEQLMQVFYDEREATMQGALARRAETIYALLRGDSVGVDTATTDLGHPLRGLQTGLVLWSDETGPVDALVPLNDLATTLARVAEAQLLTLPVGRREVWAWLATKEPPDRAVLSEVVANWPEEAEARVAVGIPSRGVDGFRQSHREAVDAQRFAVASASTDRLTAYAEVELECLVAGNEEGLRALIDRELGAMAGADKGLARVRETVLAYLSFGGNVDLTATTLVVHKNTIRYRLAQAEELLGHPLSERRTEIALALRCLGRFGATDPS